MGTPKTVKRFDTLDAGSWMTTKFTRTTEGFLTGRAIVTSIGVFTYQYADGTVLRELRLPEEVFAPESLESMKLKPVTNQHPDGFVTPENQKELQVGSLGSDVTTTTQIRDYDGWTDSDKLTDGIHVAIDMTINRDDAIDDVLNGRRSLSMGYTCEIEETSGVYMGVEYDCIQRKIRYNHCAIVDAARAGDAAMIHLDGADAILTGSPKVQKTAVQSTTNKDHQKQEDKSMKQTVRIDGIDYEAEEGVIKALHAANERADKAEKDACGAKKELDEALANAKKAKDELEKKISEVEAERDTAKDKADSAEKELADLKKSAFDEKKLDEAVKAKIELIHTAEKAGVEVNDGMSDAEIKKAVILKSFPNAKFDGKDDVYIQARYDATVEMLSEKNNASSRQFASDLPPENRADENDARKRMIARMKNHGQEEK